MPDSRAAWPSVAGRWRASFCRTLEGEGGHLLVVQVVGQAQVLVAGLHAATSSFWLVDVAGVLERDLGLLDHCIGLRARSRSRRKRFHVKPAHRPGAWRWRRWRPAQRHEHRVADARPTQQVGQAVFVLHAPCPARARPPPPEPSASRFTQVAAQRFPVSAATAIALALKASQRASSTRPMRRPVSVRRMSALSSRSCRRNSARLVNMR
jgi:hypothetical protein